MTRRHILFIAPSAGLLGGMQDWLEYTLHGLEGRDWTCTLGLVSGEFHRVDAYLQHHPWKRVERIVNPTGTSEGRVDALATTIARVAPDIVAVVNIVDAYDAVARLRRRRGTAARVVMTLHGIETPPLDDIRSNREVIDGVVVTNRLAEMLATDALGDAGRVRYAPYGVPLVARSSRERPGEVVRLLYSGRLEQGQKRVLDLPEILAGLHHQGARATLSIAGGGPDEPAFRTLASRLGVLPQIHFLGALKPADLAAAYATHDALVITSAWETGPIVAWEAMSHGLPVVASRYVGSGREGALRDGENCLLFPVGSRDIAVSRVLDLRRDELRQRIVAGGTDLVRRRYSRDVSVARWAEAFDEVCALPALPPPGRPEPRGGGRSRLEAALGSRRAEQLRKALGIRYAHRDKGGEWPHSAHRDADPAAWLERLAVADAAGATGDGAS